MNDMIKAAAEQFARENVKEAQNLLRTLGKIPAPSHDEGRRAAFVSEWFKSQGFKDVQIDAAQNVICKLGPQDGDLVVFAAHTDIVFPDTAPLPMREEDGRLYAPGIGDDTANLVNLMIAARHLARREDELTQGVLIVANACEEGLGNLDGTKALFAAYGGRVKAFYSLDGKLGHCCSGAVGSYRYRVTCRTAGGHSYANFGNANAIECMAHLIEDLYAVKLPESARTTFNVGRIEGGSTVNSIAQYAAMLYEFRSPSQECLDYMKVQFDAILDANRNRGGEFAAELLGVRPGDGALNREALQAFTARTLDVIRSYYDGELTVTPSSTDSNVPLSLGIMANTLGTIVGMGAHTREEWVDLSSMETGLKIALSLMLTAQEP